MDGRTSLEGTLNKLEAQASSLQAIVAEAERSSQAHAAWRAHAEYTLHDASTAEERHGELLPDAVLASAKRDFVWLGIIDWDYRIQRPQHLASHLANRGNRVVYISIVFEQAASNSFSILASPHPGVFEVRLHLAGSPPRNIYSGFSPRQVTDIQDAIEEMLTVLGLRAPLFVLQYPSWLPVAVGIPGATIVHDCLDLIGGFSNVPQAMVDMEAVLIEQADVVVTSSQPLADHIAAVRSSTVIRNAADVDFFGSVAAAEIKSSARPVIGYFGAIDAWFRTDWLESCAGRRPDWDFVLIGRVTGADVASVKQLPNVRLLGEQPYADLPKLLDEFDVCVIPFEVNDLIKCVNPLKLYEYMAQGKPVVSSPMPEVVAATEMVYIAADAVEFEEKIAQALSEDDPGKRERRRAWASGHNWRERARIFEETVAEATPLVSVVVLSYNNWHLTRACLHSLLALSDYPQLEIIIVDNASTDETRSALPEIASGDRRVRVILNDENVGFAAGNNVGLRAARGDYVVLLNNDTYVTRGWVRDLIRPLMLDPSIGLAGPLTNNIGNEAKITASYKTKAEMARVARALRRKYVRRRFETTSVAFFCVAMSRAVIEAVGVLDETYGLGFFEDDDYCKRVLDAGFRIVIVDDVFIHHELSAGFATLPDGKKREVFLANQAIFENRWGPWKPHEYRDEFGFGA